MKKVIRFVLALMAIGGFFSIGFADPMDDSGGGIGRVTARP
jgi:hypothetical protein